MIGYLGPKDKWEDVLDKTSKSGLRDLVEMLIFIYSPLSDRDALLKMAESARKNGRWADESKRFHLLIEDSKKYIDQYLRRQASAKKAARRRKKEMKSK
jgi:hypothetical protein